MDNLEEKRKHTQNQYIEHKNNEIKELRQIKNNINTSLFTIIEENNLQNSTFKINENHIRYTTSKQTSPITLKYLESCLMDLMCVTRQRLSTNIWIISKITEKQKL